MNVLRDLSELRDMPINGLLRRWHDLYGDQPPSRNRDYLVKRLSYRIQELAHGGLSEKASARLDELADATSDDGREIRINRRQSALPVVGTRLIREWNGEAHEVTVIENGLEYRG
ncbi:MAG TPA: DUF2924 domain-containing protein, partial [Gammaproteobacteria bacterium]